MDTQKPVAPRIRQILASMERSIDSARSRRVNALGGSNSLPETHAPARLDADRTLIARADATTMPQASKINQVIGGPPPATTNSPALAPKPAGETSGPPRLKARPKRFEGTFPTSFTQPAYRSQTG